MKRFTANMGSAARRLWPGWGAWIAFSISVVSMQFAQIPDGDRYTAGILPFELAGTAEGALALLRTFSDEGLTGRVWQALAWDLPLIAGYTLFVCALLAWLAGTGIEHDPVDRIAAQGIVVAAICDLLEDCSMATMLLLQQESLTVASPALGSFAFVGAICALVKWTLIVAVFGHLGWRFWKWLYREIVRLTTPPDSGTLSEAKPISEPDAAEHKGDPASESAHIVMADSAPPLRVPASTLAEISRADLPSE
jgi:hypothetical protein